MKSDGITLREVRETDLEPLFEWLNDVELRNLSAAYRPVSWLEHVKWVTDILKSGQENFFVIAFDDSPIGVVHLTNVSQIHRSAEFSIRIGDSKYRGKGYGTQALRLLMEFCWNHMNLHRLALYVLTSNTPAIKSYQKVGFENEGCLREAVYINGRWHDLNIMSILNPNELKS